MQLPEQGQFWKIEVEGPITSLRIENARRGGSSSSSTIDLEAFVSNQDFGPPAKKQKREQPQQDRKVHNLDQTTGLLTTNRRNVKVCAEFQKSNCHGINDEGRCLRDPTFVHQCAKCLKGDHGADKCTLTSTIPAPKPFGQNPSNKGKGKGKGEGGKDRP